NKLRQQYIAEIEQLPYGEAVLVLPNRTLQNDVKLHHMIKCIGLDTLALEIGNAGGATNFELLNRQAQELIVNKILQEHKSELQYFHVLLNKQGLVKALANLFTELRRCHVNDAEELQTVFELWADNKNGADADLLLTNVPVAKNHDIVLLYSSYLTYLEKHNLYDLEGQFSFAIDNMHNLDKLPYKKIYLSDMPFLNQLQTDFINALGKKAQITFVPDFDFRQSLKEFSATQPNVMFRKYSSHRDEILGTLTEIRHLLDNNIPAEKIAIIVSKLDSFTGVSQLAENYGIPVTLPQQITLALQPLFLQTIEQISGYDTVAGFQKQLQEYLNKLNLQPQLGKDYQDGKITLQEIQTHLSAQDGITACMNELQKSYTLSGMAEEKLSATVYQNLLRDIAAKKKLTLAKSILTGVTLTEQINAVGKEYDYLFILGMNDGEFPSPIYDNWIYTDNERSLLHSLGFELPLARERYTKNALTFLMVLQTGRQQIVCSWAEEDKPAQCTFADELLRLYNTEVEDRRGQEFPHIEKCLMPDQEIQKRVNVDTKRCNGDNAYLGIIGSQKIKLPVTYRATELENFAQCPFAYLAKYLWHLDDYEQDEDVLSPADDGSLMHKTLELFIDRYIKKHHNDKGQALLYSELGEDKNTVKTLLQAEFDTAFETALNNIDDKIKKNVLQEKQLAKTKLWLAKWFEKDFEEQWDEPEVRHICVEQTFDNINLWDKNIRLKGRIDLIDGIYNEDGSAKKIIVTDYKRSNFPKLNTDLQIGIYQLAAQWLDKVPDLAKDGEMTGSYYSLKNLKESKRPVDKKEFTDIIKGYTNDILAGNFDIRNCRDCSAFCPYLTICRKQLLTAQVENDGE
ncbi:MAG: PD-(D/E)XK nuclease family protein, partial [Phascolarctobacterium sp.]|nr:PD-(D/E)XK nuclease family protein [Candidatus Phascolarctobacterium caballi]